MLGRIYPTACPLYGGGCAPRHPVGPCMVSDEGACRIENDIRGEQRRLMASFGSQQDAQSELPAAGQRGGDAPV